jgi:hypothetical protein
MEVMDFVHLFPEPFFTYWGEKRGLHHSITAREWSIVKNAIYIKTLAIFFRHCA